MKSLFSAFSSDFMRLAEQRPMVLQKTFGSCRTHCIRYVSANGSTKAQMLVSTKKGIEAYTHKGFKKVRVHHVKVVVNKTLAL